MTAHRYWRARFESPKSLHLSEFQLLAGVTRVDTSATLTSNIAPVTGALANLYDDDTSTGAVWPLARAVQLVWDFGGGTSDVSDIRLGSTLSRVGFPTVVYTDWSDDGTTWTFADVFGSIVWPGYSAKTTSEQLGNFLHALPMSSQTGSPPPVISASPTVLLVDNNGLFLPYRNPNAGAIVQVEFGRASIAAGGLGMYAALTTHRAIDSHRANTTNVVNSAQSWVYDMNGQKRNNGTGVAYGATWTTGDVIGATFNTTTGAITFYKNGVTQGVAYTVIPGDFPDLTAVIVAAGSSGQLNGSNSFLRTRGFTYPIAGAVPWEDRVRIVTTMPVVSAPGAFYGAIATAAARASFALAGVKGAYRLARDFRDPILGTGRGRVKGTTKDKNSPTNIPVSERVRLYRESDGVLVQEKWSTAGTGAYSFDYVDELQNYTVLSYDHDKLYRAVVADGLTLANGGVEYIGAAPVTPALELRVREIAPLVVLDSVTTINLNVPIYQPGDLLVALVMTRSTVTTPSGWTLQSDSTADTASGTTQRTLVYTRVATSSEPTTYPFVQSSVGRFNGQMLTLTSPLGTPAFNVEGHGVKNNTPDSFITLPAPTPVSPGTRNMIAVGVSSSINAYPDALVVFPSDWTNYVRPTSPTNDNRLALAYKRMNGDPIAGNALCNGATGNALTVNVLIFTDP